MGILDIFTRKAPETRLAKPVVKPAKGVPASGSRLKHSARSPARRATSDLTPEERRYLRELRTRDPLKYQKIMDRRLGLPSGDDEGSELVRYLALRSRLRKAGLEDGRDGGPSEREGLRGFVTDLMDTAFGSAIGTTLAQQGLQGVALPQFLAQMAGGQVQQDTPPPAALLPDGTPGPATNPPPPTSGAGLTAGQYLIPNLDGKSPAEAAAWLAQCDDKIVKETLPLLAGVPDSRLIMAIGHLRGIEGWAEFADWLDTRHDWFLGTVTELRPLITSRNGTAPAAAATV